MQVPNPEPSADEVTVDPADVSVNVTAASAEVPSVPHNESVGGSGDVSAPSMQAVGGAS